MKSIILSVLVALAATSVYSQVITPTSQKGTTDKISVSESPKHWYIGVSVMPGVDYRLYVENTRTRNSQIVHNAFNSIERPKAGAIGGVVVCYNFNKLVGLQWGVQYSNFGFQSKWLDTSNTYFIGGTGTIRTKYTYNFHYIGVPVKVNFKAGKGPVRFIGTLGLDIDFLVKASVTNRFEYIDGHSTKETQKVTDLRPVGVAPNVGAGIEYGFNNKHVLRVQPTFTCNVFNEKESPLSDYLYNVGVNVSFLFGVK